MRDGLERRQAQEGLLVKGLVAARKTLGDQAVALDSMAALAAELQELRQAQARAHLAMLRTEAEGRRRYRGYLACMCFPCLHTVRYKEPRHPHDCSAHHQCTVQATISCACFPV